MSKRYPDTFLDDLRARVDIVELVGGYVPLKKNGRRYWGLCPFHGEKTASFSVDAERQLYYCFGCKAGGTVIQFTMAIERLDFGEAVAFLADRAHIPLPEMEEDPFFNKKREQRERLLECNRMAAQFFHKTLYTPAGKPVLDYLYGRGLTDAVITKFGLGAAPEGWDTLTKHLQAAGYTLEELGQVGLTVIKEAETLPDGTQKPRRAFDMFRSRAIFPIIDQYGHVLAFGGRILGKGVPKYLNTSDTPVFNKRLGVYAANLLRKERHLDRVVLVEGYMDVVALTQFGVTGVCATLGTALTQEQARLLKRFAPMVYLAYDGDSAGQHAILRGLDIFEAEGMPVRVLDFPDGLDPDEFIRRDGPEGFAKLPAVSGAAYRMRRLKDDLDLSTSEGRTEYARRCAPILRRLEPVDRENLLQELIVQTGFPREVLAEQIGVSTPAPTVTTVVPHTPRPAVRPQTTDPETRSEELLISLISTGKLPGDIVAAEDFTVPLLRTLYEGLTAGHSPASLVEEQATDEDRATVTRILLAPPAEDTNETITMANDCINRMKRRKLEKRIQQVSDALAQAQPEQKAALMNDYLTLTRRLKQLKSSAGG